MSMLARFIHGQNWRKACMGSLEQLAPLIASTRQKACLETLPLENPFGAICGPLD
jgi:hypothetical protein